MPVVRSIIEACARGDCTALQKLVKNASIDEMYTVCEKPLNIYSSRLYNSDVQFSALGAAAAYNHIQIFEFWKEYFCKRSIDWNTAASLPTARYSQYLHARRPLYIACYYNHVEIVEFLLNENVDPSVELRCIKKISKYSCLFVAIKRGYTHIVSLLLQAIQKKGNLNPAQSNYIGQDYLYIACENERVHIVKLLLQYSLFQKSVNNKSTMCQSTVLTLAVQKGNVAIVRALLECCDSVDVNKTLLTGARGTVLHECIRHDQGDIFILLCQYPQTDLNSLDQDDNTPLHICCQKGKYNYIKKLLQRDDIQSSLSMPHACTKMTPLSVALQHHHIDCARLLQEHGASAFTTARRIPDSNGDHDKLIQAHKKNVQLQETLKQCEQDKIRAQQELQQMQDNLQQLLKSFHITGTSCEILQQIIESEDDTNEEAADVSTCIPLDQENTSSSDIDPLSDFVY